MSKIPPRSQNGQPGKRGDGPVRPSGVYPALAQWQDDRGERTITTFDDLWRAACCEMNALEAPTAELKARHLAEARELRSGRAVTRPTKPIRRGQSHRTTKPIRRDPRVRGAV